jgi:hypothetical protein
MKKKADLKNKKRKDQKGKCALSKADLSQDASLNDAHRIKDKAKGGLLSDENTQAVEPVAHMKKHDNYVEREKHFDELKTLIDAHSQVMKFFNSTNNRILAMKRRTDHLDEGTLEWLKSQSKGTKSELVSIENRVREHLKIMDYPIITAALGIRGVGPMTVSYMLAYINIEKANHASSLWKYCGLHCASHERYEKGKSSGGNKTLRTALHRLALSMVKTRSVYRDVYDAEKKKLAVSRKMVKSRNTEGRLIECMWKDTKPCHRDGAGMRKMIKHFLADWWFVHRELEGLPTTPLYVEEQLGHTGIIRPKERGWIY